MKLSMMINYVGDFPASAQQVVDLEKVGLDIVWVAEAYPSTRSPSSAISPQ
ncbi:MAG: hypothetical protein RIQ63_967 [Actinomycetota bacterium]